MIIYNINPVLLDLGPVQIRYYSLAYIFGIILSYIILRKFVKENRIANLDTTKLAIKTFSTGEGGKGTEGFYAEPCNYPVCSRFHHYSCQLWRPAVPLH